MKVPVQPQLKKLGIHEIFGLIVKLARFGCFRGMTLLNL